jgi:hypothetical protein
LKRILFFTLCAASLCAQPIVIQTSTILDGRGGVLKDRQPSRKLRPNPDAGKPF